MSKYTTELRYIVQSGYDLGLKEYPIFDETYRETLNQKIINHYYMREIGFETAGLFKFYLNVKMNEIMPYYNQLYLSEKLAIDPLETYSVTETTDKNYSNNVTRTETTNRKDNTQDTGENKSLQNDTPMGKLGDPFATDYASTAQQTNATNTTNLNSDITNDYSDKSDGNETFTRKMSGKNDSASQSELLLKYRETFLNIDMMVIEELDELFMQIW